MTDPAAERLGYIRALADTACIRPDTVNLRVITDEYVLPLIDALEAARDLAADWEATTGDSPAHEATRSCGRQLAGLTGRILLGGTEGGSGG